MKLLTQAEYSQRRKVSREAVRKAVRDGRIELVDGKIDPVAADRAWKNNTDLRKPANSVNGRPKGARANGAVSASASLATHHARRAAAQAEREELKLASERGQMVPLAAIEEEVFALHRRARDRLRLIEARLGAILSPEARQMLRKEIREVCEELGPARRATPVADAG